MHIDLNADLGESFGSWVKGNDEALLDIISSANIACGFHAGDPDVMAKTIKLAKNRGVGIGAHPGFDDLVGFGRRRLNLPIETIQTQRTKCQVERASLSILREIDKALNPARLKVSR